MRRFIAGCAALAVVFALSAACGGGFSALTPTPVVIRTPTVTPVSFPTTQVRYQGAAGAGALHVEVASTPEQSERGLGYRDTLADDAGMLFDLHATRIQQFWMKGMRFPLDFVWIAEDKRVAGITADAQPQPGVPDAGLQLYAPPAPVRYVLEINAGEAARRGLGPGAALTFDLPSQ